MADKKKTPELGSDILVQCLVNQGVDTVFAYPGGATIPIHQSLTRFRDKIRIILPRHEQGCGFGAQGYARSSGKVGVCMATSGPGATNLVTTIADAKLDSVPIVAITGQVSTAVIGTDAFQESPIVEVCRSITKHHYLVTDVADVARIVREAFYVATTGRKGPVLIDIPKNVQLDHAIADYHFPMDLPGYDGNPPLARRDDILAVAELLRKARKPLILTGGGVVAGEASDELTKLARRMRIPVASTLAGLGSFPADDPLFLDMIGMHGSVYANLAASQADLLVVCGGRFDDRVTGKVSEFAPRSRIVHIDIDPSELNKIKEADIPVASDVKYALSELNKVVEPESDLADWHERIEQWKQADPLTYDAESEHILAQHAIALLCEMTKDRDPIIATGVGQHQMWAAQFFKHRRPRRHLTSGGLGTMGFGLPAAIGAKAAHPNHLVIDIDGDGSLLMNIQEMATCHCEKLPVKVLLLNNMHLGMVVQWEDRFHAGNRAHTYLGPIDDPEALGNGDGVTPRTRYPDFVAIAKGFEWEARHVVHKEDLRGAIQEMIDSPKSFLLDVQVPYQEHVLPMIPSGATVNDLIRE